MWPPTTITYILDPPCHVGFLVHVFRDSVFSCMHQNESLVKQNYFSFSTLFIIKHICFLLWLLLAEEIKNKTFLIFILHDLLASSKPEATQRCLKIVLLHISESSQEEIHSRINSLTSKTLVKLVSSIFYIFPKEIIPKVMKYGFYFI